MRSFGEDTCRKLNLFPAVSLFKGQQVAVGDKEKTALPSLVLRLGSEGRAVLTNVLCMFGDVTKARSALLSLCTRNLTFSEVH